MKNQESFQVNQDTVMDGKQNLAHIPVFNVKKDNVLDSKISTDHIPAGD